MNASSSGTLWWRLRDLEGKVLAEFTTNETSGWVGYRTYVYRDSTLLAVNTPYLSPNRRYFSVDAVPQRDG